MTTHWRGFSTGISEGSWKLTASNLNHFTRFSRQTRYFWGRLYAYDREPYLSAVTQVKFPFINKIEAVLNRAEFKEVFSHLVGVKHDAKKINVYSQLTSDKNGQIYLNLPAQLDRW